jgi:hypothetical protein
MSSITKHQIEKPDRITRDFYGVELSVGLMVAFNYAGSIRKGVIVKIEKNDWKAARDGVGDKKWWYPVFEIHIEEMESKNISKVKNPESLIAI